MRNAILLAILAISTLGASQAQAATKTFDGGPTGSNGDFSVAANWSGDTLPNATDELLFNGTATATSITNVQGTYQRIVVSRPAGSQSLAFFLSGNLTLTGASGTSIFIDVGEGANFSGSGGTRTIQCNDDVQLEGNLSTVICFPSTTVLFQTGSPAFLLKAGSSFTSTGLIDVRVSSTLSLETNAAATLTNVDCGAFFTLVNLSGTPTVALNGTIRATAAASAFYANSANLLNVLFNNCTFNRNGQSNFEVDFDGTTNTIGGAVQITIGGGGGSWLTPPDFGNTTISATGSLTLTPGVGLIEFTRTLNIAGTLDLGSNPVNFYSHITLQFGATFNQGTVPGVVTLVNASLVTQNITGIWIFAAQLLVQDGNWRVANGSSVGVAGSFWVQADSFGAAEDGATVSSRPVVALNGNARIDVANGYALGEGDHYFRSNVDFGFSAAVGNVILQPSAGNDLVPQIHLESGAVNVNFGGSGTRFFVTNVSATTRVTSSGDWTLSGNFNLSNANGGSTAPAWSAPASQIIVDGTGTRTVTLGNRDIVVFRFRVGTTGAITSTDHVELVFTRVATNTGILTTSFQVFGDTVDTVIGTEDNAAVVRLNGIDASISTAVLTDGNSVFGGNGPLLEVSGGTLAVTDYITLQEIGSAATESHAGSRLIIANAGVSFTAGNRSISAGAYHSVTLTSSTFTSNAAWQFGTANDSTLTMFSGCNFSATGGLLAMYVGGSSVSLTSTTFGNMSASGLQIAAGSTISALSGCTFQNGQLNGAHITLNGLANVARLNCPGNQFDNSVNVSVAGGGHLVAATGNNPLTFQAATADDFGLGAYTISAFTAEADGDNDGVSATEVQWQFTGMGSGGSGGGSGSGSEDGGCTTGTQIGFAWLMLLAALSGFALRRRLA